MIDSTLTSAVHLTQVGETPHVPESHRIGHTCKHKVSRTVPVGPHIISHVYVFRKYPGKFSTSGLRPVRRMEGLEHGVDNVHNCTRCQLFIGWGIEHMRRRRRKKEGLLAVDWTPTPTNLTVQKECCRFFTLRHPFLFLIRTVAWRINVWWLGLMNRGAALRDLWQHPRHFRKWFQLSIISKKSCCCKSHIAFYHPYAGKHIETFLIPSNCSHQKACQVSWTLLQN